MSELLWLGQSGFVIRADGEAIAIDPWLSEHERRRYPPPEIEILDGVDLLLVTHEHHDHLDMELLELLVARHTGLRIVLPAPLVEHVAEKIAADRVVAVQPGDALDLGRVRVEVMPAYHGVVVEDGFSDGSGADGLARFVGFLLHTGGATIYHSGDTIVTEELLAALGGRSIDYALLPIPGRDAFRERRGIVGNLSAREAVGLAEHLDVRTLVPVHWDLYDGNLERPGAVVDEASIRSQVNVLTLARFRPWPL